MRVLFTCGGTGGHINPAIAIANEIRTVFPDSTILFVGGKGNMETELVPKAGFEIQTISVDNLRRSFKPKDIAHNIKSVWLTATALIRARKIIAEFRPDIAIGTGGYVCYPVLKSASSMGIPTLLHESNALPGLTTKLLEKSVSKILLGFEEAKKRLTIQEKLVVTGTPVRPGFRDAKHTNYSDKPLIVSFWGSLGAKYMNAQIPEFVRLNEESRAFRHIHAAGKNSDLQAVDTELTSIKQYVYDMPTVMADASLVICRAGAATLNELAAAGKPSILIPSPFVAENHQEINARAFESKGAAIVIKEKDATAQKLYETTIELVADKERLEEMAQAAKSMDYSDAISKILEQVIVAMKR